MSDDPRDAIAKARERARRYSEVVSLSPDGRCVRKEADGQLTHGIATESERKAFVARQQAERELKVLLKQAAYVAQGHAIDRAREFAELDVSELMQ